MSGQMDRKRAIQRHGLVEAGSGPVPIHRPAWKLEDAKARFSELVRRARSEGPQRVTVRGKEAVVVISVEQLDELQPNETRQPLVDFMESLYVEGLDLDREPDRARDVEL